MAEPSSSLKPWITFAGGVLVIVVLYWAQAVLVPIALAILLSFAMTRRRPVGYTTTRESQVDPVSGSRVDRTDVDPR